MYCCEECGSEGAVMHYSDDDQFPMCIPCGKEFGFTVANWPKV